VTKSDQLELARWSAEWGAEWVFLLVAWAFLGRTTAGWRRRFQQLGRRAQGTAE